jgi:dihydropteroate synthase
MIKYILILIDYMRKINTSFQIECHHANLNFSTPKVMGILNVTPDSFYDANQYNGTTKAIEKAIKMIDEGADIIDIGGQSTRPNAILISAAEELDRIADVVLGIRNYNKKICISVDTFYASVAKESVTLGADIINDVSAGQMDDTMLDTIAQLKVPYIMMHMQGEPTTMQMNPTYQNVQKDVINFLENKISECKKLGIENIIVDPGFGFGKTLLDNYTLLNNLEKLQELNCPILIGISRKSMVYKLLQIDAVQALNGTSALHMIALQNGANVLRVHDVVEAKQVITLHQTLLQTQSLK